MTELRYPVGEQDFAKIRTQNLIYVDKTEVLYRLVTTRSYYFLSRTTSRVGASCSRGWPWSGSSSSGPCIRSSTWT